MKIFNRLNKMALLAFSGLVIGGCGFFGDLFGVVDSTKGKLGEGQSICNSLSKDEIFPTYYKSTFKDIGGFMFGSQYTIAQVEKLLGAQVHYMEFSRSDSDKVCAFIMATNTAYKQVRLTSQEIANLEKTLADTDAYSEYEKRKEVKDSYYTAMKFLKYHNRFATPKDSLGLRSLRDLSNLLWAVDRVDNTNFAARNITATRFIHGKAQDERVYKEGPLAVIAVYTNINAINAALKSPMLNNLKQPCHPLSNAECSSRINEIREIKSYAESLLQ